MTPRLFLLVLLCAFGWHNLAAGVRISESADRVTLRNETIEAVIDKRSGHLLSLKLGSEELLSQAAYLDWHDGSNHHLSAGRFSVALGPEETDGEMAEIRIERPWHGTGPAFDVALHYALRGEATGLYMWASFSHPKGYPPANLGQSRMVFRLRDEVFDFIAVDEARRRLMPSANAPSEVLGPKESYRFTEGPFAGFITDKYHFFASAGDHFVHGWLGTTSGRGLWVINGSREHHNGGPTKQHNTAHHGRILLNILTCGHYGAGSVAVDSEEWAKLYGPWMLYANRGAGPDEIWADAQRQADVERAAWPYAWVEHPLFPKHEQRGTVLGRIYLPNTEAVAPFAPGGWVGLAPGTDWQREANGYQFWKRLEADGTFAIENVRPGRYTLHAFAVGEFDPMRLDDIAVEAGSRIELPELRWTERPTARKIWQIGVPDRSAAEFRHGENYRRWGLWLEFPRDFPQGVDFRIGESNERTDWNFAHVPVTIDGRAEGTTWRIRFRLDAETIRSGEPALRLAFAAAHNASLRVFVNQQLVGSSGRIGSDNALARAGAHGQYRQWDVPFSSSLLQSGENIIALELVASAPFHNVMYDAIRLEMSAP
jgi:rhamnogalacturonan endolyase